MGAMASQINGISIVYSTVSSGAYQRKHQSSASLDFVRGIHRPPVNSPHKEPVTRKMFPFDDVILTTLGLQSMLCICVYCFHAFCVCVSPFECFRQRLFYITILLQFDNIKREHEVMISVNRLTILTPC